MSVTRATVIAAARQLVQDVTGNQLLNSATASTGDYERVLDQALRIFESDVPNNRVVLYTVTAAAFRFVLRGTSAILSGLDAWTDGRSIMNNVWHPYATTSQNQAPLDSNDWRVIREPSLVILELLSLTPSSGVLRLDYTVPHVVDASTTTSSSILTGDVDALYTITAALIAQSAQARAAQNTGTSNLPSDVVDRRTQDQMFRDAAKTLMDRYKAIVGRREIGDLAAASATAEFDVDTSHAYGMLWHPRGLR